MGLKIISNEQPAKLIEKDPKAQCLEGCEEDEARTKYGRQW